MSFAVRRGEIWYAQVPFKDDPTQTKLRPVVVLGWSKQGGSQDSVILVVPVTSFGVGASPKEGDIEITNWPACGFNKPSWVRARRLWGADPQVFNVRRGPLGTVTNEVMSAILVEIERLF